MIGYIRKHPLLFVLIIACLIRLPAVVWSHGYIHSDDHFDTVEVAYDWLRDGPQGDDGYLRWKNQPAESIARFPLYTLSLYGVMKLYRAIGVESLDTMMYGIRFLHALVSLLPVWAAFLIVRMVSRRDSWAALAGLMLALNFALPFLGVRNLIEIVGGNIWVAALYCLYRYTHGGKSVGALYAAGIVTGLAWMIRFQMAFAVLPIPLILWYERRSIMPAVHYSLGVAAMLVVSGLVDYGLLGGFAASTIRNLTMNTSLGALYSTVPLLYPLELLAFLVPPFSFLAVWVILRPSFWKQHKILWYSTLCFVLLHMSHANQQERFIMPIVPAVLLLAALALWEKYRRDGYVLKSRRWLAGIVVTSLVINVTLLSLLTGASGHRGMVEPLVWMEKMRPRPTALFVLPELGQWMPLMYGGLEPLDRASIRTWDDLQVHREARWQARDWDYIVLYPRVASDLPAYLDSVRSVFGPVEEVRRVKPSFYDGLLHSLNRRHNPSFEAWIYRPIVKK